MRKCTLGWVLSMAMLLPTVGTAQVYVRPNPYPQVTAANAAWQQRGTPVFHAGAFYYPSGPSTFFDGNVMQRTGTFEGVPLYEDATQTPFTVVYVPLGGNVVRPYERRREGELAGSTGSRAPSFPIQTDGEVSVAAAAVVNTGIITPANQFSLDAIPEASRPVGTADVLPVRATGVIASSTRPAAPIRLAPRANTPAIMQVWISFDSARWYSAGSAVAFSPDRFVQVGEYLGSPVYRARNGAADQIYIPSVADGPVAPFKKR